MDSIAFFFLLRFVQMRLHVLVIVSCLGLALLGLMPESSAGWYTSPPVHYLQEMAPGGRIVRGRGRGSRHRHHGLRGKHVYGMVPVVWS